MIAPLAFAVAPAGPDPNEGFEVAAAENALPSAEYAMSENGRVNAKIVAVSESMNADMSNTDSKNRGSGGDLIGIDTAKTSDNGIVDGLDVNIARYLWDEEFQRASSVTLVAKSGMESADATGTALGTPATSRAESGNILS